MFSHRGCYQKCLFRVRKAPRKTWVAKISSARTKHVWRKRYVLGVGGGRVRGCGRIYERENMCVIGPSRAKAWGKQAL